jgi:hypothetical protein
VFILYRRDGTRIAELTSGRDGTASYELPVGTGYYLEEKTPAVGFQINTGRHSFSITHGKTTPVRVMNAPIQGTVEIRFKHVSDGRELADMVFLTDKIGTDYIKWMRTNKYENRQIDGYTLIRTDYPNSLVLIDGTLTVTLWYGDPAPGGGIHIPKTGMTPPYGVYALSLLCWMVAAFCAVTLVKGRKQSAMAMAGVPAAAEGPAPKSEPKPQRIAAPVKIHAKSRKKKKRGRR